MKGIYIITNTKNKKHYIGKSTDITKRWKRHLSELKSNKHHNVMLQNDFNKFGENYFNFNIIEVCNENDLSSREKFHINMYKSSCEKGYNFEKVKRKEKWNSSTVRTRCQQEILNIGKDFVIEDDDLVLIHFDDIMRELNLNYITLVTYLYYCNKSIFEDVIMFKLIYCNEEYVAYTKKDVNEDDVNWNIEIIDIY